MHRKTSKFLIGLFVTFGSLIGVAVVIWLGASKYFQKGQTYVTYFDESVQGLQVDSSVKYRGVEVGRVEQIRVAPDDRLIAVIMKIDLRGELERDTVAQLKVAGITGIVFIELDRRDPQEPDLSPAIDFPTEYPVIPSRPSQIKQILTQVDIIMGKLTELDIEALSTQLQSSVKAVEEFLKSPQLGHILVNLESLTASLDEMAGDLSQALDGKAVAQLFQESSRTIGEARKVLADSRRLLRETSRKVASLRLEDAVDKTTRFIDGLDQSARALTIELRLTSENLRRTTDQLEQLLDRLNANPSDLIFSRPPEEER